MKIIEVTNVDFALRQFILPVMRGLRAAGHDVIGVSADGPDLGIVRSEGFTVIPMPLVRSMAPVPQLRAFLALRGLFKRERPDVVHAHMPISGLLARFAAWSVGVPVIVYTCHGFLFNQPGSRKRRGLAFVMEWLAGKITDLYLTVSREEAHDARRLGIAGRATAIGNGRDPAVFRPDVATRQRIRQETGTAAGKPVILAVSRLVRHKGYPELLRAMEAVPDAELWVVGARLESDHGAVLDRCFEQAQKALGPRLKLLGHREDVAALMAAADIFVLPSHFEGLPMSIIEAMLSGLPVVSTDIRGPREQIEDGVSGFLVQPGLAMPLAQALNRLVTDPDRRIVMGEAARHQACERYQEASVITTTVSLIEQAASRRGRA